MRAAQSFVGRDEDCDTIAALLADHRLVTLVGPGGVGKTRLASELSSRIADRFDGGISLVELSGTTEDDDVEGVASRQLGVDSIDAFLLRTADSGALLVLDNCESSLAKASRLADDLVERGGGVRVLATSRSPLRARHERVVGLEPLDLPGPDVASPLESAAVRLLLDRARAAGAGWTEDEESVASDVGRLVRKLDGLPLAIELAAARARTLGPKELDALLDVHPDLLSRPARDGDRHHSLHAVIGASYAPLSPDEQRFFRRLCVMSAPFPLELAHAVAGADGTTMSDTLDRLGELVDASLVDARTVEGGRTEYRLLDAIRAFGREQLEAAGEGPEARAHHADAMTAQADELVRDALQSFSPEVLGRIRDRFVHLAAAISWCIDHDPSPARAYRMFIPFYGPTGARAEVAELAKRVRATWSQSAGLEPEAWAVMGTATFLNGDYEEGAELSSRVLAHPDATPLAKLWAHRTLGFAASVQGDPRTAAEHLDRAIEYATPFSASFARELRISRAGVAVDAAESREALDVLHEVGREAARNDEIVTVVWASVVGAYHRVLLEDLEGARRAAEAAVAVADRTGLPWSIGTAHRTLASVLAAADGWDAAQPHFRRAFDSTLAVGDVEGVAMALRAAAGAALHVGDDALARALWATIPPVRGLPVVRSIFHELEERLASELGPPIPLDGATLTRTARRLLGSEERATAAPAALPVGAPPRIVRFEDCELDLSMQELRRNGERVHVEPQVFDVLAFLVERRGSVVTTDEILDEVWSDRHVSMSVVSSRVAAARRATGDDGKAQRIIRTVRGKGFAFVAEVR